MTYRPATLSHGGVHSAGIARQGRAPVSWAEPRAHLVWWCRKLGQVGSPLQQAGGQVCLRGGASARPGGWRPGGPRSLPRVGAWPGGGWRPARALPCGRPCPTTRVGAPREWELGAAIRGRLRRALRPLPSRQQDWLMPMVRRPCLLAYVRYLQYWKQPDYAKYLVWACSTFPGAVPAISEAATRPAAAP